MRRAAGKQGGLFWGALAVAVGIVAGFGLMVQHLPWQLWITSFSVVALLAKTVSALGWRSAALAVCLCVIPPGVIAEGWGWLTLPAYALICLVVASAPKELPAPVRGARFVVLVLLAEGACWAAAVALGQDILTPGYSPARSALIRVAVYSSAGLSLYLVSTRPRMTVKALRATTWLVTCSCFWYLVALVTGFGGPQLSLPFRLLVVYAPGAFTHGLGGIWRIPRFSAFSGEPGLAVVVLLVALWSALRFERGIARLLMSALLIAGIAFTQSAGAIIALAAVAVGAGMVSLARRTNLALAVPVTAGLIWALRDFTLKVLLLKEGVTPSSLASRGIQVSQSAAGLAQTSRVSISLVAALRHGSPLVALPLFVLIGYLIVITSRRPLSLGLVLGIGVTGLFAQPLQYYAGIWMLLAACVLIADEAVVAPSWTNLLRSRRRPAARFPTVQEA
jgi:hypothetical protein